MFLSDIFKLTAKLNADQTSEIANELLEAMREINKVHPDTFSNIRLDEVHELSDRLKNLEETGRWEDEPTH